MNIAEACKVIRRCNESIQSYSASIDCERVPLAVSTLKTYLETARADGKSIDELLISESMLLTPQGMRWVMSFATAAEAMEANKKRMKAL
jgi:hypothetical protein